MAILPSLGVIILYIYVTALVYIIFLVPVILFFSVHFSDTWGVKKRLKYGIPILIILLVLQAVMMTPVMYADPGTLQGTTPGDSNFTINISPYSGTFHSFTVNATFNGLNESYSYKPVFLLYSSGEFLNLTDQVVLKNITALSGTISLSEHFSNISTGDYYVDVILNYSQGNVTTGFVRGPIIFPEIEFTLSLVLNYVFLYVILAIIFIAIVLFSKSISKSQRKALQYKK